MNTVITMQRASAWDPRNEGEMLQYVSEKTDAAKGKKRAASMQTYCTVPDDAPINVLLKMYRHLWEGDARWLTNLPNIPNPRKERAAAILTARAMLPRSEKRHIQDVGMTGEARAA